MSDDPMRIISPNPLEGQLDAARREGILEGHSQAARRVQDAIERAERAERGWAELQQRLADEIERHKTTALQWKRDRKLLAKVYGRSTEGRHGH